MKTHFLLALLILMIFPNAAMADRKSSSREGRLDQWIDFTDDLDYEIIDYGYREITDEETLRYSLSSGRYHIFAEGSDNIKDLDLTVYDSRGREIVSDSFADNIPIVEFSLSDKRDIEIVVSVFEFARRNWNGDFIFLIAKETDRKHDRHHDNSIFHRKSDDDHRAQKSRSPHNRFNSDIYDKLDELRNYADDQRMSIVFDDIARIESTLKYDFELGKGRYVIFASADSRIDDLDLHIYDKDGWTIASDISTSDSPALWVDIDRAGKISVEIEVWSFNGWESEGDIAILVAKER